MTKEELKAQYPEIVAEIEAEARNSVDVDSAVENAVAEERARLSGIDAVARLFDAEIVNECKYTNPCTAEQLTLRAAQEAVAKGSKFLDDLNKDGNASGTSNVGSAVAPTKTEDDPRARGRAAAADYNAKKEGKVNG